MRILMILTSIGAYMVNGAMARAQNAGKDKINFEAPLTNLVWLTSILSIVVTFVVSHVDARPALGGGLWWKLSVIISCGTLAAARDPRVHQGVHQRALAPRRRRSSRPRAEGGASLNILSGLVAGNFSVFWKALTLAVLLFVAY